jgi:hypothetical protein
MQKISKDTCAQKNRAEPEGYAEGQTFMWITENNITNTDQRCKLKNRRVPNGMHGGVRGQIGELIPIFLLDFNFPG